MMMVTALLFHRVIPLINGLCSDPRFHNHRIVSPDQVFFTCWILGVCTPKIFRKQTWKITYLVSWVKVWSELGILRRNILFLFVKPCLKGKYCSIFMHVNDFDDILLVIPIYIYTIQVITSIYTRVSKCLFLYIYNVCTLMRFVHSLGDPTSLALSLQTTRSEELGHLCFGESRASADLKATWLFQSMSYRNLGDCP